MEHRLDRFSQIVNSSPIEKRLPKPDVARNILASQAVRENIVDAARLKDSQGFNLRAQPK